MAPGFNKTVFSRTVAPTLRPRDKSRERGTANKSLSLSGLALFASLSILQTASAQVLLADPLALPQPRPNSVGAYQWYLEALNVPAAWQISKGRALISAIDGGYPKHPDFSPGLDGNYREHLSKVSNAVENTEVSTLFHGLMTTGVMAARGFNGIGVSGVCAWCSLVRFELRSGTEFQDAIASGATVINLSYGALVDPGLTPGRCPASRGEFSSADCDALQQAAERDLVLVGIAQNQSNAGASPLLDRIPFPANHPDVIAVGGIEANGQFWTRGYSQNNTGSNWGAKMRLVAPAKDMLMAMNRGLFLYGDASGHCGERVDSTLGPVPSLSAAFSGYGTCTGNSFAGPAVSGIVGLMRSVNPLLSAKEIRHLLFEAATRSVAGPVGSNLEFYVPDARAAVQSALSAGQAGAGKNRLTPLFTLYSSALQSHLQTTSPQTAVAASFGELLGAPSYVSAGLRIAGYENFPGKRCDATGELCEQPQARALFSIFTTEHSPIADSELLPLVRLSRCELSAGRCTAGRRITYASHRADITTLEGQGFLVDQVEGYLFQTQVAGSVPVCLGHDPSRADFLLFTGSAQEGQAQEGQAPGAVCTSPELRTAQGQSTAGNYQSGILGYIPGDAVITSAASQNPRYISDYSDIWWAGSEQSGWGVSIIQHRGQLGGGGAGQSGATQVGLLFVYDDAGKPIWYILSGGNWNADFTRYSGAVYETRGAAFDRYDPALFRANAPIGTVSFEFTSHNTATMRYALKGINGTQSLKRQIYGGSELSPDLELQDLWWGGAAQSGWGIAIHQKNSTLFPLWFTYDDQGLPTWFAVPGGTWSGRTFTGKLFSTRASPWLAGNYDKSQFLATERGSLTLQFLGQASAQLSYTVDGITQRKALERQGF